MFLQFSLIKFSFFTDLLPFSEKDTKEISCSISAPKIEQLNPSVFFSKRGSTTIFYLSVNLVVDTLLKTNKYYMPFLYNGKIVNCKTYFQKICVIEYINFCFCKLLEYIYFFILHHFTFYNHTIIDKNQKNKPISHGFNLVLTPYAHL